MGEQFTPADVLVMASIDRMADLGLAHVWEGKYPHVSECLQFRPLYMEGRG